MVASQSTRRSGKTGRWHTARRMAGTAAALSVAAGLLVAMPASTQDAASPVDTYAAILQQTSDVRVGTLQREYYVSQQEAEIARLTEQLEAAQSGEGEGDLLPQLRDMVAELEAAMVEDLPIRVEARFAKLDNLREDIRADDAAVYDGYRRAMDLIAEETEFGLYVDAYSGPNPVNPGQRFAACQADPLSARCDLSKEQKAALDAGATVEDFNQLSQLPDGNYIHFGRMALLFLERDSSEGYRYSAAEKAWQPLPNSELLALRQNVRIARGESAVSTMTAPIAIGAPGAAGGDDAS